MEMKCVNYEKKENISIITLNRPEKHNALSKELLTELQKALENAENDPEVKVVIITGAGRSFCAGADITEFAKREEEVYSFIDLGRKVLSYIESMNKPVIAAVHGYTVGGGLELALACDFIVAATNAVLGSTEINIGIIPGWGATYKLIATAGISKARELVMLGETIRAEEAYRLGLVHRLAEPDKLMEEAMALAKKLLEKSSKALALTKKVLNTTLKMYMLPGSELERLAFFTAIRTEDAKEGITAFLEKRKPKWKS